MAEQQNKKSRFKKISPLTWLVAMLILLGIYIGKDPKEFMVKIAALPEFIYNFGLVLVGFGAVIFIHELGHFIAAKSVGIFVEAFSIGFGPILFGFKKIERGFQIRILPTVLPGHDKLGLIRLVIPLTVKKTGETEYQIRLIPLGGFVKMLGQEDVGADKPTDNPRAFVNKAIWQRLIVISAGVVMNVICGAVVFIVVFANGVDLQPAVVGDVLPDRPAALAGFRGGDEILAIDGKTNITFMDLMLAGAFAQPGEKVHMTVRHPDGAVENLAVTPQVSTNKKEKSYGFKQFGIEPPTSLTIYQVKEPEAVEKLNKIGIPPGGNIIAVNGQPITRYDQLRNVTRPALGVVPPKTITLTSQAKDPAGKITDYHAELAMIPLPNPDLPENIDPQILSMVPRLKVSPAPDSPAKKAGVQDNDIVIRLGAVNNPTVHEMRDYCRNFENKPVELVVLRRENDAWVEKTLQVTPQIWPPVPFWKKIINKPAAMIGVGIDYDWDHPVVADCVTFDNNIKPLDLPRGCQILSIAGQPVADWNQILATLAENRGRQVDIEFRDTPDSPEKHIAVSVPQSENWIGFIYRTDLPIPLEPLQKLYQGKNWTESLTLGLDNTWTFIAQTYLSVRGMISGNVSPSAMSGPVGIMKISYRIVEDRSSSYYFYFFAMISICIAGFNFLPLPILDGGYVVMLLVEKIKGSPVPVKIQEIINYAGLLLIGGFFLYVTFNDIVKWATGLI